MRHRRCGWTLGALAMALLLPLGADAQTCNPVKQGEELVNPPEIPAKGGWVTSTFDVQEKSVCIPKTDNKDGTWTTAPMTLRTYVYPSPATGKPTWGLPGPTLRLRRTDGTRVGDGIQILLKNSLPFPNSAACNSTCSAGTTCDCSSGALGALIPRCTDGNKPPAECCCVYDCTQKMPNCQHGDNITNLHFHGSHVSPQEPQDFVLLDLFPPRPAGAQAGMDHSSHGDAGKVVYGQFQYRVEPFGAGQPEGSHWYHPHRHGSTSLQVGNGLAGAMLIEGPFDDWLKQYYSPTTGEKVMVVQAITNDSRLGAPAGQVLVNGQVQPKITGKPGEIQRWRIINATMSSRTLLKVTFPEGVVFRQIAMDGIRFSPINYECQPLLNFDSSTPAFPCNPAPGGKPSVRLAPGNRADFLVQFPLVETVKSKGFSAAGVGLRFEGVMLDLEEPEQGQPKLLWSREPSGGSSLTAGGAAEPALFTMVIDDQIEGNDDKPKTLAADAPAMPATLPPMPANLRSITDAEVSGNDIDMTFQQFLVDSQTQQWPYSGNPLATFKIDSRQFTPECANVTTTLDKAAQWTIDNATLLRHPFHIHTNPFQLVSVKNVPVQPKGQTKPEPVWMDTLMLPTASVDPAFPPDLTKPYEIKITEAPSVIRQRYEKFTGAYVLHCHILGHEDRGMMLSVQTVCGDKYPDAKGKYGRTTSDPNGECAHPPYLAPLPVCK